MPLGILLGFGFPTGLAAAQQHNPKAAAWFWGINGAAGVMASCVAVVFNLAYGLETTMFLGAACYALLALVAVKMGKLKGKKAH
jgi:ABC-type Fe3+-siderophore transport system permease subunit